MNYSYYKNIRVSLKPDDYKSIEDARFQEIMDLAQEDVNNNRTVRQEKEFKNISEYKLYLAHVIDYAGKKEIGLETDLIEQ